LILSYLVIIVCQVRLEESSGTSETPYVILVGLVLPSLQPRALIIVPDL